MIEEEDERRERNVSYTIARRSDAHSTSEHFYPAYVILVRRAAPFGRPKCSRQQGDGRESSGVPIVYSFAKWRLVGSAWWNS